MKIAVLLAALLQFMSSNDLALEGERLGRFSTLFAVCEPYYTVDLATGRRLANDFEQRAADAGWTRSQWMAAYDRGRDLERAEIGLVMDSTSLPPAQARNRLREMFPRLKQRCRHLATEIPGAVLDVEEGNRRLNAAARRFR